MKRIILIRRTHPDSLIPYGDTIKIIDGTKELYSGPVSTNPNPYKISTKSTWRSNFAQVAPGEYVGTFDPKHSRFGKTLLITTTGGSLQLKTTNPNPNHGGSYYAEEVFIHKGDTAVWRGSTGCITVPPNTYNRVMSFFKPGEKVAVTLSELYGAVDTVSKVTPFFIFLLLAGGSYLLYNHLTKTKELDPWPKETDPPQLYLGI